MKFPLEIFKTEKNKEKLFDLLKYDLCDNCLGRSFGMIGHGFTNEERGEILRKFASELMKQQFQEPKLCTLCGNFFKGKIDYIARKTIEKTKEIDFETFLIGTILPNDMAKKEEEIWEKTGVEDVEPLKSEINREVGKRIEKLTKKTFSTKNPDMTIILDLPNDKIRTEIRSLYISGKYQKLVRGIPQTKWICPDCRGKGCKTCKGTGKLYKTSVQEEIEKSFLKSADAKKSTFHGAGREDIDARNLDWRPFVIELVKPLKRKIDLKKIQQMASKNKKVKIKNLKFASKDFINKIKFAKIDKTYSAEVLFLQKIDKKKLKLLRKLNKTIIMQQTPTRVAHRRANILRKRMLKSISWKQKKSKLIVFKIKGEGGLYIKELINGDEGRTKPNIAEILGNKVKKISLDVVKIHTKGI